MAMDISVGGGYCYVKFISQIRRQLLSVFYMGLLIAQSTPSPMWMPQVLSEGMGRNIRNLPCVSLRTGEQGTCMFAYTCMKANGTHLGTCIDRFYFGSCCKLDNQQELLSENDINYPLVSNNKVTPSDSESTSLNKIENVPNKPITTTDKVYVPISSLTLNTTESTPTTTQQYLLSTFQVVHDNSVTPTTPTTTFKQEPKITTSRPLEKTTSLATTTASTTKKTTKPIKTTTKKPPVKKPTRPSLTPKPTTRKPIITTKRSPTTYQPVSTITVKPTTIKRPTPTKATTTTTSSSTTSEVVFTKPGGDFMTSGITTFRPDLSTIAEKPTLITGPSLSTFNYITDKVTSLVTTETTSSISSLSPSSSSSSSSSTSSTSSTSISTSTSTSTSTSSTSTSTSTSSSITSSASESSSLNLTKPDTTKVPWIEIMQENSTSETLTASTTSVISSTSFTPSFGDINVTDYTQVCGRRLYPEARVVGGEKSSFGKWPWQISLRQWRTSTYLHKCGAALLNENWAITAAHCVENVPPSDLLLRLGEHDLSTEDEPYGYQERRVQIVASHPQFDPRTFEYDLALLRFYEPVKFQPNIIPICVPEDNTNFVGETAHVTGWGRLYEDGPLPSILQEVSVPVINNTLCESMYRSAGYIEVIPEIFICAGWKKGGFDSCEGDSGGPMVIQRPDKRWLLAGVISWGIGCAEPNQPGVYTRISEFRDWINQILQF